MTFKARPLMVQLPCGPITVIEAEQAEADRRFREILGRLDDDGDCPQGTADCTLRRLVDQLCAGSHPIDVRTVIDADALPALRKQLEERLREIVAAEEAVAQRRSSD